MPLNSSTLEFAGADWPLDETTIEETVQSATVIQSSTEGREGMLALIEKRKPIWTG